MQHTTNISPGRRERIVYIVLVLVTLAVYWQVNHYNFVNFDDPILVTKNYHIQSGINLEAIHWAFTTIYAGLWHPLTSLSLMFDYQLYGLNADGYHLTNLVLHILSTLLLFWLFNRMTGALWCSAFVASFFAIHPLHVESVAWVEERKDVLSTFFWMLTLCLYVYYTEKPVIKRYFLVVFSFVLALLSKPMVVTLPVVMLLLDYWPLRRFAKQKENLFSWQLKEKLPFFILSAVLVVVTLYMPYAHETPFENFPLASRMANAPVAFVTYLIKTFWPYDLAVFYPFPNQIPVWKIWGASLLIIVISAAVIAKAKQLPYLFAGWIWYVVTILPVIGIVQTRLSAMADHYTYLPSMGIAFGLAYSIPALIKNEDTRKKILLPSVIVVIALMAVLAWKQCSYWRDSITLWNHTLKVTDNNYIAHSNLGDALFDKGKIKEAIEQYNKAIGIKSDYFDNYTYNLRGVAYAKLDNYEKAIESYNDSIRLKADNPDAYLNRGQIYDKLGEQQRAFEDYDKAIQLRPDYTEAYNNRGSVYIKFGQYEKALDDFNKAIRLNTAYFKAYTNRGIANYKMGRYQSSIDDYSKAIKLKKDYTEAYNNRGVAYFVEGNKDLGCHDAQKACFLGNCRVLEWAKSKGDCN